MRGPIGRLIEWSDAHSFGGVEAYRRFQNTGSIDEPEPEFDPAANGLLYDERARVWHPTVQRPCLYPVVEAENGHIVLHPRDWQSAMLVIGAQGSGKSSLVLRHYLNAIQDVRGAVVLVDPKRTLALRALAYTPRRCGKNVWYLNLRRPAFGMSPMRLDTSPQAIMNAVVDGLCDAFPDELYQSSRELIQCFVLAALALAQAERRAPRIEDVYHLMVWENEALRARAIAACSRIPNGDLVRDNLAKQIPGDMARAPSDMSSRLRAPRNKLAALLQAESLRVFFNHTTEKPLEEIIADRDILIVDADLGEGGRENARVVMHFILRMLDSVLLRQQGMPKDRISRVHLIIDEAGRVMNEHIMAMVDSHREVGLDVLAALHYMDQLKLGVLKGALNLFRNKYVFRISESGDAKRLADDVSGMVYDSLGQRTRASIWPDAPKDLSNNHCLVSHLVDGRPSETFLGRTYPMAGDSEPGWRPQWLQWLEEQAGEYPEHILWTLRAEQQPDTITVSDTNGSTAATTGEQPSSGSDTGDGTADGTEAARSEKRASAGRPLARLGEARRLAQAAKLGVSPTRLELAAFSSLGIDPQLLREQCKVSAPLSIAELAWIDGLVRRSKEPVDEEQNGPLPRLNERDLLALSMLDRFGFMTQGQLGRSCWPGTAPENVRQRLVKLARAGLVHRYAVRLEDERGGRKPFLFALSAKGLRTAQHPPAGLSPSIEEGRRYRQSDAVEARDLKHDLHVASWLLSLREAFGAGSKRQGAPPAVISDSGWRTPRRFDGHLDVPALPAGRRGERRAISMLDAERSLPEYYCFADVHAPQAIAPDLSIELQIPHQDPDDQTRAGTTITTDLLVELDNSGDVEHNRRKFRHYDSLLCGWALALPRYQALGARPFCLFVCPDVNAVYRLMRAADREMTGAVGIKGTADPTRWYYAGRDHIAFTAVELIHHGLPTAWLLPAHPPNIREQLGNPDGYRVTPVSLLDPRLIASQAMDGWALQAGRAITLKPTDPQTEERRR